MFYNTSVLKTFYKIHRRAPVPEPLLNKGAGRDSDIGLFL